MIMSQIISEGQKLTTHTKAPEEVSPDIWVYMIIWKKGTGGGRGIWSPSFYVGQNIAF